MRGVTLDPRIAPDFAVLDLDAITDAALTVCSGFGASYAAVRVALTRSRFVHVRDGQVETAADHRDFGVGVRVVLDGAWGFAACGTTDPVAVRDAAARACELARRCAALPGPRVELADNPPAQGTHVSAYQINPFDVPINVVSEVLTDNSARLTPGTDHTSATYEAAVETTFLADLSGSRIVQQRVRSHPSYTAIALTDTGFDDMSTTAGPIGRGWEYALDDWGDELLALPDLLAEKVAAPSVTAGRYDLVVDPTNLWLTIHESVGHATEKDRALGYEANYAGTSFATVDRLGTLQYGSELMNIRADRTAAHGLSTVGWDDEAVEAGEWDLVRDGVLVGYQLDRQMAGNLGKSNGCAYADSAAHVPIQRMPNVSLRPAPDGPDTESLIGGVENGIYVVGDKSWSIDMQRYNFQFTGQRFFLIRSGRLAGQVRDVAYQSNTLEFWNSLTGLGGPQTYVLGGALNCGKGQPGQVAAVSHGCPSALFSAVNILNTKKEAVA